MHLEKGDAACFCKITNFATYIKKHTPENEKLAYKARTWNTLKRIFAVGRPKRGVLFLKKIKISHAHYTLLVQMEYLCKDNNQTMC